MPKKSSESCYDSLLAILMENLEGEVRDAYVAFHITNRDAFLEMPAAIRAHHAWPGGYATHIFEVTDNLMRLLPTFGLKDFTRQEAVIAAYVHDLDKLFWRYQRDTDKPSDAQIGYARGLGITITGQSKTVISQQIDAKKSGKEFDLSAVSQHIARPDYPYMDDSAAVSVLMADHKLPGWNRVIASAVSLHHGGWAPLAKTDTKHSAFPPLAVLLHTADMISAQIQNGDDL